MVDLSGLLSLKKRNAFLARADAVRRLQLIGENRRAAILKSGMLMDIDRLRGDLRYATPQVNQLMKQHIEQMVEKIRNMRQPEFHGHVRPTGIPAPHPRR
jgi:hypothetical protein